LYRRSVKRASIRRTSALLASPPADEQTHQDTEYYSILGQFGPVARFPTLAAARQPASLPSKTLAGIPAKVGCGCVNNSISGATRLDVAIIAGSN
jgi:hypothetical protein